MIEETSQPEVFKKHLGMFAYPKGSHLTERTCPLGEWVRQRAELRTWPYARSLQRSPSTRTRLESHGGLTVEGINFGSQDYLGLSSHPAIYEAA
jgi:glycine C-acetyltransferase